MIRIFLTIIISVFIVNAPFIKYVQAQTQGIAIVVNDDVISTTDVNDRLRLIMRSSGFPDTQEVKQRLLPQIVGALIDEQLMMQEAKRVGVKLSPEEIDAGLAQIALQNKMQGDEFIAMMQKTGVNVSTLERQISSQLLWNKVIQKKFRPKVVISESDIDAFIDRIKVNTGKMEYLASEILLPVPKASEETKIKQIANDMAQQVRAGRASFFKLAQQFSKAAGAAKGGDLGWVQDDQIDQDIANTLANMEPMTVSNPLRTPAGIHLLLLRSKRKITEENIPPREKIEQILGIKRLERMQARLLLDLKSSAFIENRI